jgi:hypothetical protein
VSEIGRKAVTLIRVEEDREFEGWGGAKMIFSILSPSPAAAIRPSSARFLVTRTADWHDCLCINWAE